MADLQKKNSNFFIRRFHSLIALIPIGIFLCTHLLLNSGVLISGNESYLKVLNFMKSLPFLLYMEIFIIALPIIFHGIYGIYIVYLAKNNVIKYKYYRNFAFYLQRVTALITLFFVIWHVITLRILVHESQAIINTFVIYLQNPLFFIFYLIGVIAAIYHFANGLFTFCITWGICVGDRSQKIFYIVVTIIFILLAILATATLIKISLLPIV